MAISLYFTRLLRRFTPRNDILGSPIAEIAAPASSELAMTNERRCHCDSASIVDRLFLIVIARLDPRSFPGLTRESRNQLVIPFFWIIRLNRMMTLGLMTFVVIARLDRAIQSYLPRQLINIRRVPPLLEK